MSLLFLLVACAPKVTDPPDALDAAGPDANLPAPLKERPFVLPEAQEATLSNGLRVAVVENHEVPIVWGTVAFFPGGWVDPPGKEGLCAATMDMMSLGAGTMDSVALSAALRQLGSGVDTAGGLDGAWMSFSTLARNLDPTLALVETVLTRPTFPEDEWDFLRKQYLDKLQSLRNDPTRVASRVLWHVLLGDRYRGRIETESSYNAITLQDMQAFHRNLAPQQALLLVGGDTTLAEVRPLLEKHLAGWNGQPIQAAPIYEAPDPMATSIQLVDFPGKPQSVVRMATWVGSEKDAGYFPLLLADTAIGGQFTARINMNLREERGFTYGARSSTWFDHMGAWWTFNAGIQTPHTAEAIAETLKELRGPRQHKPVTGTELGHARSSLVDNYPLSFENTGYLLGQERDKWRYGLPDDWVEGYVRRVEAVSVKSANAAWNQAIHPDEMLIVVAGDAAVIRPELEKLGFPIVERTADGELRTH